MKTGEGPGAARPPSGSRLQAGGAYMPPFGMYAIMVHAVPLPRYRRILAHLPAVVTSCDLGMTSGLAVSLLTLYSDITIFRVGNDRGTFLEEGI